MAGHIVAFCGSVFGPVDRAALRRLASSCFLLTAMTDLSFAIVGSQVISGGVVGFLTVRTARWGVPVLF